MSKDIQRIARHFCPAPTYSFENGESVRIGALKNPVIIDRTEDKKYYKIQASSRQGEQVTQWFAWHEIRKLPNINEKPQSQLATKDNHTLSFYTQTIESLLSKSFFFGVDFDPDYQRDFVWNHEDKLQLIHSIFEKMDIGKFVFVKCPFTTPDRPLYQILDGKQRLSAITEYYLDKFPYKGYYYSDLSTTDMYQFKNLTVPVCELPETTSREEILTQFIRLNTTGHTMPKNHLNKIIKMLGEITL